MTVVINHSGLSHKRTKKGDPRLPCDMLHNIYNIYSVIKNEEENNAALMLTRMLDHKNTNKVSKTMVNSNDNNQNEFTLQVITIAPPDLH